MNYIGYWIKNTESRQSKEDFRNFIQSQFGEEIAIDFETIKYSNELGKIYLQCVDIDKNLWLWIEPNDNIKKNSLVEETLIKIKSGGFQLTEERVPSKLEILSELLRS